MPLRRGSPILSIRQPSQSTTQYTVSNAPVRLTRVSKLQGYLTVLLRLALAAALIFALQLEFNACASCNWDQADGQLDDPLFKQWDMKQCSSLVAKYTDLGFGGCPAVAVICVLLFLLQRRKYKEESLLLIRGLGIQTSTSSASYLVTPHTRFIPTSQIQDIFIHEAFIGFEVKFYLAVIVEGEKDAVVVFPKLMPNREILEEVWRGAKMVLYLPTKLY